MTNDGDTNRKYRILGWPPHPWSYKNRSRKSRQLKVVVNFMILIHPPNSPTEINLNLYLDLDQTKIKKISFFSLFINGSLDHCQHVTIITNLVISIS